MVELARRVLFQGAEQEVSTRSTNPLKLVSAYFMPVSRTTSPPYASLNIIAPDLNCMPE